MRKYPKGGGEGVGEKKETYQHYTVGHKKHTKIY